ncbi:hypothetical protein HK105_201768 [Polyrhizophydium stewartii]|uniref:VWFA domain-containing protein n=1 Tax=Polyrhizophydium stewartii TaxID=2732419 RepID=A0ABR4NHJ2_9FUNG
MGLLAKAKANAAAAAAAQPPAPPTPVYDFKPSGLVEVPPDNTLQRQRFNEQREAEFDEYMHQQQQLQHQQLLQQQQQQQQPYGDPHALAAQQQALHQEPRQYRGTPQRQETLYSTSSGPSSVVSGSGPSPPHIRLTPSSQPQFHQSHVAEKLNQIIHDNRLQAWYGSAAMQGLYDRLAGVDFAALGRHWRISPSIVFDLCSLALFDVVFFIDDSGSMVFEEDGSRIDDLKFILAKAAEVMTLFDDDGVQVRFMNSNVIGEGIRTTDHVNELVERVRFSGMTPLGTQFKSKVIDPIVLGPAMTGRLHKPVLAIIITDGEPTREPTDTLRTVILDAKKALSRTGYGPGALSIQIGQVGTDMKAQQFLSALDNDPEVGNMIDCTSNYEMESEEFNGKGAELSPELWLLKLCVGAIDRSYDDTD